jgi:hypothetical protein
MLTGRSAEGVANREVIKKAGSEFASKGTTSRHGKSSAISSNHSEAENAAGHATEQERGNRAAEKTELERLVAHATGNARWISVKILENVLEDSVKSSATSSAFGLQRVLGLPLRTCSGFRSLGSRGQVSPTVAEWQACSSSQGDSSSLSDGKETRSWNFRMGQNAIAGALAGAFVSLCLHPIDTLKTVIQAQTGQHPNLFPVLYSIISQRGEVCFCLSTCCNFSTLRLFSVQRGIVIELISWRLQASKDCTGAWVAIWRHLHQPQLFIPLPMKQ